MPKSGVVSLTNLPAYDNSSGVSINSWVSNGPFTVNGKKFSWSLGTDVWKDGPRKITYQLNGNYSTLNFQYGIDDGSDTNVGYIEIYGDNNIIFDSSDIERLDDPKKSQIDEKGIKYLTIEFHNSGYDTTSPIVGEPVLIP